MSNQYVMAHKPKFSKKWELCFTDLDWIEKYKQVGADVVVYEKKLVLDIDPESPKGIFESKVDRYGHLMELGVIREECLVCSYFNPSAQDTYRCHTSTCPSNMLSDEACNYIISKMGW